MCLNNVPINVGFPVVPIPVTLWQNAHAIYLFLQQKLCHNVSFSACGTIIAQHLAERYVPEYRYNL